MPATEEEFVRDVQRLRLEEGDIIVVSHSQVLSQQEAEHIHGVLEQVAPGHQVLIVDAGMQLSVLSVADLKLKLQGDADVIDGADDAPAGAAA